jgi:hypothetical protein
MLRYAALEARLVGSPLTCRTSITGFLSLLMLYSPLTAHSHLVMRGGRLQSYKRLTVGLNLNFPFSSQRGASHKFTKLFCFC